MKRVIKVIGAALALALVLILAKMNTPVSFPASTYGDAGGSQER